MKKNQAFAFSLLLFLLVLLSKYPFKGSEDIMAARETIQSGTRSDFWGSFSPWFFSLGPRVGWENHYAVLFALLISISLFLLLTNPIKTNPLPKLHLSLVLSLSYIAAFFAVSFSRDGALVAFVWTSIALFAWSAKLENRNFALGLNILAFGCLILAFSFRPWLSFCIPMFLLILFKLLDQRRQKVTLILLILTLSTSIAPILVDMSFHRFTNMRQSYPEQQVMIMDISTIACLASERMVSDKALLAFQTITRNEPLTKSTLCSQYYPASWASVAIYGAKDGESSAVRTLQIGETLSYSKFREAWFNLISSEPSSFVQAKLLLGSQLLLAGESPKIRIKNIRQSLQLPFEILKAIRLFSIIPSLILIFAFGVFLRRKNVIDYQIILGVLGFYLIAITLVIVAFIGDNQRYILPFTLISLLLLILGQENSSRKQVNHG